MRRHLRLPLMSAGVPCPPAALCRPRRASFQSVVAPLCAMPLVGIGVAVVCETGTEIGSAVVLRSEGPSSVDSIPSFRTQFVGMPGLLKYRSSWRPVGSGLQPAVSSMTASFSVYDRRQRRAHPRIARCRSEHGRTRTKRSMGRSGQWVGERPPRGDTDRHPCPRRRVRVIVAYRLGVCPLDRRWRTIFWPARLCQARRQGSGSQPPASGHRVPPPVRVQRDPGSDYRAGVASSITAGLPVSFTDPPRRLPPGDPRSVPRCA